MKTTHTHTIAVAIMACCTSLTFTFSFFAGVSLARLGTSTATMISTADIDVDDTDYSSSSSEEEEGPQSQSHSQLQRQLARTPSSRSGFVDMCVDEFMGFDKLYRDNFGHSIFGWIQNDMIEGRQWDTSFGLEQHQLLELTQHYPNFHRLPDDVADSFVDEACPSFTRNSNHHKNKRNNRLRFCRDPFRYARTPAGIYMSTTGRGGNGDQDDQNDVVVASLERMCDTIRDHWDEIVADCARRWENKGLIAPRDTSGDGKSSVQVNTKP
jgi:hypothetical protein